MDAERKNLKTTRQLCFVGLLLVADGVFANEETQHAVQAVQSDLRKPSIATEAGKMSPEARQVVQQIKNMTGGGADREAEIYSLAADVLGNMQNLTPEQMEQLMQAASKDPEGFAKKWTPEQQKKLKEISERLPASQKKSP